MADFPTIGAPDGTPTFKTEGVGRVFTAKYPADLTSPPYDKWMMISAMSGRHVVRNQAIGDLNTPDIPLRSIGLYIPEAALVSQTSVAYDRNDLGPMVGAAAEFLAQTGSNVFGAKGGQSGLDAITAGFKDITGRLEKALGDGASWREFLKADVAALLSNLAGSNGGAVVGSIIGQKPNPRTDILFDTQEYRTHDLDWLMVPRSLDEAKAIDTICYFFNYYMLPRYQSTQGLNQAKVGAFMVGFPYEFEVNMYTGNNNGTNAPMNHVNRIGRSVVKSVSINHAAGGKTAFIKSNGEFYPVATRLQVSFQEVRLLARDDDDIKRGLPDDFFNNPKDDPRA